MELKIPNTRPVRDDAIKDEAEIADVAKIFLELNNCL